MNQNILQARHNCPLAISDAGENRYSKDGKSGWRVEPNGDYSCDYCGSLHPEQFVSFLDTVITDPNIAIRCELNDRREKVYIERPGIKNAGDGAIKFYLLHLKQYCVDNNIELEVMDKKLHQAFVLSNEKFKKHFVDLTGRNLGIE